MRVSVEVLITFTITDPDVAAHIGNELTNIPIDGWIIDDNGDLVQVSTQIATYHANGMGFGVLVKLYALAQRQGIPVQDLVDEFQNGKGMGQIFKEYGGKPSKTGVGHVRHDKDQKGKGPPVQSPDDPDQPGKKNNGKKPDNDKDR